MLNLITNRFWPPLCNMGIANVREAIFEYNCYEMYVYTLM